MPGQAEQGLGASQGPQLLGLNATTTDSLAAPEIPLGEQIQASGEEEMQALFPPSHQSSIPLVYQLSSSPPQSPLANDILQAPASPEIVVRDTTEDEGVGSADSDGYADFPRHPESVDVPRHVDNVSTSLGSAEWDPFSSDFKSHPPELPQVEMTAPPSHEQVSTVAPCARAAPEQYEASESMSSSEEAGSVKDDDGQVEDVEEAGTAGEVDGNRMRDRHSSLNRLHTKMSLLLAEEERERERERSLDILSARYVGKS